ncbi:MAG: BrnA antitoxin family protein [Anaerolineae bacterium]|nr:BrnA antitoxin family protein [Anaerolineae bacterium]
MSARDRDPIPEHFSSAEEAGEFWDTHSAADYWDEMEPVEMEFDIQRRIFMIPVDSEIYHRIKQQAEKEQRSVEQVIQALLERELA